MDPFRLSFNEPNQFATLHDDNFALVQQHELLLQLAPLFQDPVGGADDAAAVLAPLVFGGADHKAGDFVAQPDAPAALPALPVAEPEAKANAPPGLGFEIFPDDVGTLSNYPPATDEADPANARSLPKTPSTVVFRLVFAIHAVVAGFDLASLLVSKFAATLEGCGSPRNAANALQLEASRFAYAWRPSAGGPRVHVAQGTSAGAARVAFDLAERPSGTQPTQTTPMQLVVRYDDVEVYRSDWLTIGSVQGRKKGQRASSAASSSSSSAGRKRRREDEDSDDGSGSDFEDGGSCSSGSPAKFARV